MVQPDDTRHSKRCVSPIGCIIIIIIIIIICGIMGKRKQWIGHHSLNESHGLTATKRVLVGVLHRPNITLAS